MFPSYSTSILTDNGRKDLFVYPCDLQTFGEKIDILVTSAFKRSYAPAPRTVFQMLYHHGINVSELAAEPEIDLRSLCQVWLSQDLDPNALFVGRIACVEFLGSRAYAQGSFSAEQALLNSLKSLFMMLDIAAVYGIPMETVAMPLLGSGNQQISPDILLIPILNECVSFLRRNPAIKRLCFVERNEQKAKLIEQTLQASYNPYLNPTPLFREDDTASPRETPKKVFISYSSKDKEVADALCQQLEQKGIDSWYAPRDVRGAYAESIMRAIKGASQFVVILSENSMQSKHVLNEIDAAFQQYPNLRLSPLRIDDCADTPSVSYYLNRQHCQTARPPDEEELARFAERIAAEFKPE